MTFLKLLLSNSIIYLAMMAIVSPVHDEESKIKGIDEESKILRSVLNNKSSNMSDYIFPTHYDMTIMLDNNYLHSGCIITLNIFYAKQYISFYVPDTAVIVYLKLNQSNSTVYETNSIKIIKNNIHVIDFGDVLLRGIYDLCVEFLIPINIVRESFGTPYINKDGEIE